MKTTVTEADHDKVWRVTDTWLHYAWVEDRWRAYPCDPRRSPDVMSIASHAQRDDGTLADNRGFVEVKEGSCDSS